MFAAQKLLLNCDYNLQGITEEMGTLENDVHQCVCLCMLYKPKAMRFLCMSIIRQVTF